MKIAIKSTERNILRCCLYLTMIFMSGSLFATNPSGLTCTQPPVLTCPTDYDGCPGESLAPSNTGQASAVAADAGCSAPSLSYTDVTISSGLCSGGMVVERTWTASANGLSSSCVQTISLIDNTPPVITGVPADLTINCDAPVPPAASGVSAEDECCGVDSQVDCFKIEGSQLVDGCTNGVCYTFTYDNNNEPATVTITSGYVVSVTIKGGTVDTTYTGTYISLTSPINPNTGQPFAISNIVICVYESPNGGPTCNNNLSLNLNEYTIAGNCPNEYTLVRTWIATDACGNTDSVSQNINVVDVTAPTAVCQDISIDLDANGIASISAAQIEGGSSDNCSANLSYSLDRSSFSCADVGANTVTLSVSDECGNTGTCSATVTVNDNEAPVAVCQSITVQLDANGTASITAQDIDGGSNDACGIASISVSQTSFDCDDTGSNIVSLTVTDNNGNVSICDAIVTVEDNQGPAISCPADITVNNDAGQCGAVVSYNAPVGTDNCAGATTVQSGGLGSGSSFPVGTSTETYTVTDAAGNSTTCSFDVTVIDAEAPEISCPADITVNNDAGQCGAVVSYNAPVGTDNCAGATTVQSGGLGSGSSFPVGTSTETYTVTDAAGNSSTCSFDVTVIDAEAPVISCPADITVNNDAGQCGAVVSYNAPVGTDNCSGATTAQSGGLGSGSSFPVGTSTETYTVTDAAGNSTTCSFDVTVIDAEAPVIACPADITVNNDAGQCGAVVSYNAPVGTDNCAGATTVQSGGLGSGSSFPVGTSTESYTVTDAAGNSTTCSFDVTVIDAEAPVISCPADITVDNDPGECGAVVSYNAPVGTDNCPGAVTVQSSGLGSGSSFPVGSTTETYTVTDAAGNTASCSFTITVNDTEAPSITCPADLTFDCIEDVNIANPNDATVSDNCDPNPVVTVTESDNGGAGCAASPLVITRTYTVTDLYGNSASCSQTINVALDTLTEGSCHDCEAEVSIAWDCLNPNCVWVTSCKDLSNVVLVDINGNEVKFDDLPDGDTTGYFCHPSGDQITTVYVKSGCYESPIKPGYGYEFNLCGATSNKGGSVQTAEAGILAESNMEAFPNPFSSALNIRFSLATDAQVDLVVYNLNGEQVASLFNGNVEGGQTYEQKLNSDQLTDGVYFVRLISSNGDIMTQRVVLTK